jgi:hypothetical protein
MKKLMVLASILAACGDKSVKPTVQPIPPSNQEKVEQALDKISPLLITCDGGPTDNQSHNMSGRPQCNTGDSILPTGLLSTVEPKEEYKNFIYNSIDTDGRPYRSPEHLKECKLPGNKSSSECTFSRDHLIGLILYSIATKDITPVKRVYEYSTKHWGQFCDGSYSQCSISLPVYDLIGDAYTACGEKPPFLLGINDYSAAYTELITAEFNDTYALELAVNYVYAKMLSGNLKEMHIGIVNKAVEKQPWNLYFRWLQAKVQGTLDKNIDQIVAEYLPLTERFEKQGLGTVWYFQWGELENINGHDLYFFGKLLLHDN